MHVLGIIQLYGYVIGWWQYDLWWSVIRDTGLFYIPFAVIFGRAVLVPFMSQETRSAAVTAIKRLGVSIVSLLLIIIIFYAPAVTMGIDSIKFEKDGHSYVVGKTGSTYDHHIDLSNLAGNGVYIPVGWVLMIQAFNAMAGVGFNSLSDGSVDNVSARQVMQDMGFASIKDPVLKAQANAFMADCYQPAYADYVSGHYPDFQKSAIDAAVKKYGQVDLGWMGSHVLNQYFYSTYRAKNAIAGFPFDPNRDIIEGQVKNHGKWGRPYCNNWWSDSSNGLKSKLWTALKAQFPYQVDEWFSKHYSLFGGVPQDYQNAIIQSVLQKSSQSTFAGVSQGYYDENDMRGGAAKTFGTTFSKVGIIADYNTSFSAYIDTFINMLPVIQSCMFLALFALLPFGAVLSCFSWRFLITASSMLFALVMMTYIWHLVSWFDNLLMTSLYESVDNGYQGISGTIWHYVSSSVKPAEALVDMAVVLFYVAMPTFLFGLIGWAGINVGDGGFGKTSGKGGDQSRKAGDAGVSALSSAPSAIGKIL